MWLVGTALDSTAAEDGITDGWKPRAPSGNIHMDPAPWGQRLYSSQNFPRIALGWGKRGLLYIDMNRVIVPWCLRKKAKDWGKSELHVGSVEPP